MICFIMLAVGTMPIATAAMQKMQVATVTAFIHHFSKGAFPTGNYIPDGFFME
jgi:hypothetical protein